MQVQASLADLDRLIAGVERLSASQGVARKLLAVTRDPDFNMQDVVKCLESDPALAARILRIVNSSRYGLVQPVTNVRQAAAHLGQRSLRMFVVSFALLQSLTRGKKGGVYSDFWQRTLLMASAAGRLGHRVGVDENDAYTAGLLADVGVLILSQNTESGYHAVYEIAAHGGELTQLEESRYGFSHPVIGARLLQVWDLPKSVVEAVALHHADLDTADDAFGPLDHCVRASGQLAELVVHPRVAALDELERMLEPVVTLDRAELQFLIDECCTDFAEGVDMFADAKTRPTLPVEELGALFG
jgi:HD-like signal output (HDOD) protein